jgi:hypothetical protein
MSKHHHHHHHHYYQGASDARSGNRFGWSLALDHNQLAVGIYAYIYIYIFRCI